MTGSDLHRQSTPDHGFTLIEALVMLVLGSLLSLVVLESVRVASLSGLRIEAVSRQTVADSLDEIAVRRILAGVTVEYRDSPLAFQGTPTTLSGYSIYAPGANGGAPVSLAIVPNNRGAILVVNSPDIDDWVLGQFQNTVTFRYFDASQNRWFDVWPPPAPSSPARIGPAPFAQRPPSALAINLESGVDADSRRIIVSLPADANPPVRSQDFFAVGGAIP